MYEEFISSLPITEKHSEKFLVKGLRLPFSDSEDPLSKIADEYYLKRENIFVFGSPLSGKITGILEIVKKIQNYVILTDADSTKYFKEHSSNVKIECCDAFDFENSAHEFIIFYNTQIPFDKINYKSVHLSGFYDYVGLFNPELFRDYISKVTESFPADFIYTTISKYPQKKTVQFIFGTDGGIKHLCVQGISEHKNDMCLLYSKCEFPDLQLRYFESQNVNVISSIPKNIKANKLIFYDIDLDLFNAVIDRIDKVFVIYTKDEFNILNDVVNIVDSKNIEVSETLRKLIETNSS